MFVRRSILLLSILSIAFFALVGCEKDPYSAPTAPNAKPDKRESGKSGSLQDLFKAPKEEPLFKRLNAGLEIWKVDTGKAPRKGPKDAPITIVEFSDFQCPYCSKGANKLEQIVKKYKGQVRLFFKHYPLSFHKDAHLAAQAAVAAQEQGKFWEYHDKLFKNARNLKRADLDTYAKELGLNALSFKQALDSGIYKDQVDQDMLQATKIKVSGTPTVFLNGQKASVDVKKLDQMIQDELKRLEPAIQQGYKGDDLYKNLIKNGKPKFEIWKVETGKAPWKGAKNALVTITEYSDFQCPYCSRGAKKLDEVLKKFKGKVRLVFKHYPLSFHKDAHLAAQAATAAQAQGKFWQYHNKLFLDTSKLKKRNLEQYAKDLGLDMKRFKLDLYGGKYKKYVDANMQQGGQVKVGGTPTVFVNGRPASTDVGALGLLIKEEIKRTSKLIAKGLRGEKLYAKVIAKGKSNKPKPLPKAKEAAPDKKEEKTVYKDVSEGDSPSIGLENAPIVIFEFSDFECPYCSRAAATVKKLFRNFKPHIRLIFKHYPLSFHASAKPAARASFAAQKQGKFWEYHDLLFKNTKKLDKNSLKQYAQQLDLDMEYFNRISESDESKIHVEADMKQASRVGVSGTPAFFLNGRYISGAQPYSKFKEILFEEWKRLGRNEKELIFKIPTKNSASKGNPKAPVTIVEFSDFQCPFCSKVTSTVKTLLQRYPKHVRVVFKHNPLSFHKDAPLASRAAIAAQAQGKFWEYHDKLFQNTKDIKQPTLERYAKELKLDMSKFQKDLTADYTQKALDRDLAHGDRIGVNGTPSFFVNNRAVKNPSLDDLESAIKDALKRLKMPMPKPVIVKQIKPVKKKVPTLKPASAKAKPTSRAVKAKSGSSLKDALKVFEGQLKKAPAKR